MRGPWRALLFSNEPFDVPFEDPEAEISETKFMVSRLRPSRPTGQSRRRDWDRDSNFKVSRPRLYETWIFWSCRDRDSSRPKNFQVVETETQRDRKIYWLSRPRLVETGQKLSRPRLWRDFFRKSYETLQDGHWIKWREIKQTSIVQTLICKNIYW